MGEKEWRRWIRERVQRASPLLWVLEQNLACSPRPLRYHPQFGGRAPCLPPEAYEALKEWISSVRENGIRTVVVLATDGELRRYLPAIGKATDLLALYRSAGFVVHHHGVEDPAHASPEAAPRLLEQIARLKSIIYDEYLSGPRALLIHCSGGMDRASPIAASIAARERPSGPLGGEAG
jgi:hypothetical protein